MSCYWVHLLLAFCCCLRPCHSFRLSPHFAFQPASNAIHRHRRTRTDRSLSAVFGGDDDSSPNSARSLSSFVVDSYLPRAGEDGFSVVRKPLSRSNWDPEASVELTENFLVGGDQVRVQQQNDAEWWSSSRKSTKSTTVRTTAAKEDTEATNATTEVDLFQRSLDTLDFPRVLQALIRECSTAPAKRIVEKAMVAQSTTQHLLKTSSASKRAYQPLCAESVEGARERYRAVEEMGWILSKDGVLDGAIYRDAQGRKQSIGPPPIQSGCSNLEPVFDWDPRTSGSTVLEADDILQVRDLLETMQSVQNWGRALQSLSSPDNKTFVELPKLSECLFVNATLSNLLYQSFERKPQMRADQQILSGTTFPQLGLLRKRVQILRADVLSTLDNLLALPSTRAKLALESGGSLYSEISGRLVIPVQSQHGNMGIVHDTSRSGKTLYVEPTEIVSLTNELRHAEGELRAEEARIWRVLTSEIYGNRNDLETGAAVMGQLDLVYAKHQLGLKLKGVIPTVKDEGVISIRKAKHPVLLLRQVDAVGSTVELGEDGIQGLVLTGPNAGGKTVILKLLGLLALMSRSGIPVPADPVQPRVDFFHPILADIGDLQSVGGDLSTFSGHVMVCREILRKAGENALVLMDEVGSGTDPNQGVALAQALLEALVEAGARVAVTTHFLQLKQLAASDPRFAVAGMQFVNGRPTYKLLPGTVGESFALSVAERLEMPRHVIQRATELLDSETRQMGDLIRELEDQKALVDQQVLELEEKQIQVAQMEQRLKDELARLEKAQLVARREEAKQFALRLQEKEQILESILDKLKMDPSRRIIAKSWDSIKVVKREAFDEAEDVPTVVARKKIAREATDRVLGELVPVSDLRDGPDLEPGTKIVICKKGPLLGREAIVAVCSGDRVEVRVNNMLVRLKLTEVAMPTTTSYSLTNDDRNKGTVAKTISKSTEKALQEERGETTVSGGAKSSISSRPVALRTESNTVDVRGCNFEEAKDKVTATFSRCLMSGRPVVYILHGHGTGGILRNKIRSWLKQERTSVKSFQPADRSDGGDAFTQVVLR